MTAVGDGLFLHYGSMALLFWYCISLGRINHGLDSIALASELHIVHIIHHFSKTKTPHSDQHMNANLISPRVGPQEINDGNKKLESVKGVLNMNKSSPAVGNFGA